MMNDPEQSVPPAAASVPADARCTQCGLLIASDAVMMHDGWAHRICPARLVLGSASSRYAMTNRAVRSAHSKPPCRN